MSPSRLLYAVALVAAGLAITPGCAVGVAEDGAPGEDTGVATKDTGAPPEDTGAPSEDTGAAMDTGAPPEDTGAAPADTGAPPEDTGAAPADTGSTPADTGTTPADTGVAADTGPRCPTGQTACGGACVDTRTDASHCGRCGAACGAGEACAAGACARVCAAPRVDCAGACRDLQSDSAHCGACGRACAAGTMCSMGACATACIFPGQTACGGACVFTALDPRHCGRCGNACPSRPNAEPTCALGFCSTACLANFGDCDGSRTNGCETDTRASAAHCGRCGAACPTRANATATCASGACAFTCNAGFANCDGAAANGCEAALDSATTCGACGVRCAAPAGGTARCVAGRCASECPAGQTLCGAACRSTASDPANCGACGRACATGQTCAAGACVGGPPVTGASFRVDTLDTAGCSVTDHLAVTGDDRGGIAVTGLQVFATGDTATGRFGLSLTGGTATAALHDALVTNLRDGQLYALGNGTTELARGGGTITTLVELSTFTAAPTGRVISLDAPIPASGSTFSGNVGIFAGYDRVVVHNGSRVYSIALPSGAVTDHGAMPAPTHRFCENWAYWGVAEFFDGALYLTYVRDTTSVVRTRVPDGATTTAASFTNLGDMCGIAVSLSTRRWYFHHEYDSQFGGSPSGETLGYCPGTFTVSTGPTGGDRYTRGTPPLAVGWVDACAAAGRTTILANADDLSARVALPFAFRFWGRDLAAGASVNVATNGFLSLDGSTSASLSGTLPSTSAPNAVIAPHWGDLRTRATGVCVATLGAAPARRFVVQWADAYNYNGSSTTDHLTFEAVLNEGANTIDFLYNDTRGAQTRTTGLENQTGSEAIGGCATTSCAPTTATRVRFTPSP